MQIAKRIIAHAKVTNPELYMKLTKAGHINEIADELIEAERRGQKSGKFSKLLKFIGIGSLLLMVESVAKGATSSEANAALEDFIRQYQNLSNLEIEVGYVHENNLQLLADAFHVYLKAAKVPEDTANKIMTLLRLKIGLNYDAG